MIDPTRATVLVVDDSEASRTTLARILRRGGFEVREAATGSDALSMTAGKPDAILLDVNLPDINGIEVCRQIKGNPASSSIPVLHLSGASYQGQDKTLGLDAGADGYLTKPVEPHELIAYLKALLRLRGAQEAVRASAHQWQTIFDAMRDGVCLVDLDGHIVRCNRAMDHVWGKTFAEVRGRQYLDVAKERFDPALVLPIARVLEERRRQASELCTGDRWFRVTVDPVLNEAGAVTGTVHLWADITEQRRAEEARHAAEEKFHSIFENAVEGLFQTSAEGRFLTANPALARMLGFASPEELIGEVTDIAKQLHVNPERRAEFLRLLVEQDVVQSFEAQLLRRDGSTLWTALTGRTVRDPAGNLLYFEGIVEDITQRKRAEEALQTRAHQQVAVAQLGQEALETIDLRTLQQEACSLVAKTLGVEYVALWQLLPDGQDLRLLAGTGWRDGCVGQALLGTWTDSPAGYVLLSNRPVVFEDLATENRFQTPALLREHGVISGLGVTIHDTDGPFGTLCAYTTRRRSFIDNDLHFLQGIANVLAAAIDRKRVEQVLRKTKDEFRIAQAIQRSLFPSRSPRVRGFDVGGASYPAQATGGDYFDFIPMPNECVGIVIGDVSGHGFGPALLMAETRAYLRAFTQTHPDVSKILTYANRVIAADIIEDRFITLFFGQLNPRTRTFTYASAGHLAGYILSREGAAKKTLASTAPPLGLFPESEVPPATETILEPGDIVLLLTDGIVEARGYDSTVFGTQRALDIVRLYRADSARQIVDNLYWSVRAYARNRDPIDDITAIVIKAE
jgi:PAS domain S-box-containing protein